MAVQIPGNELEKAVAEVATDASKTVIGAIRRRMNAWSALASAHDEAAAEEIKREAKHKGNLKRSRETQAEARKQEVLRFEHEMRMRARAIGRAMNDMENSQRSVEYVASKAISHTENCPGEEAREIKDDWLQNFFKYVSDVNEEEILEILARGLADAAIKNRPILSPKALDTLRFFEKHTFDMFSFASRELSIFGSLPSHVLESKAKEDIIEFDIIQMIELGLIKEIKAKYISFRIADVGLIFSYDISEKYEFTLHKLTLVGESISRLIDTRRGVVNSEKYQIKPDHDDSYIQIGLGLDEGRVKRLAYSLLSEIMDNGLTMVKARVFDGKSNREIFAREKNKMEQPFELSPMLSSWKFDDITYNLLNIFVEEFEHFDRHQLPTLLGVWDNTKS